MSIERRSGKTGLSPGEAIHVGEQKTDQVRIHLLCYSPDELRESDCRSVAECLPAADWPGVAWVDIEGLHKEQVVEEAGRVFGLHPLTVEDILTTTQRPKAEDAGMYLYLVLRMVTIDPGGEMVSEQVSLVLGANFVLSFQESPGDVFEGIRQRIRLNQGRLRAGGADYLAYRLLDAVVDGYFPVLERIGDEIEELEDRLLEKPTPTTLGDMQRLKRRLIELRKSVWPLREVVGGLDRLESGLFRRELHPFLRDVHDHTIQVIDTVETYRDMVSGLQDVYLSAVSNRMNEIMKVLTIMSTIFIPLTFIAGIYGMNFKVMPELEQPWGYPLVLAVMLAVALGLVAFFRRRNWI